MIELHPHMPEPADYLSLVAETGWTMPTLPMTETALAASLCGVVALDNGTTIGMARAIGDGVMKVYIQDVIVSRAYRRQGVGRSLINAILVNLKAKCPSDCMIGLFAAEGRTAFYAQMGFISRPGDEFGPGMHATLSDLMHFQFNHTAIASENGQLGPISDSKKTGIALAKPSGAA